MNFNLIAAIDSKRGIGKNGRLPWNLPSDLAYYQKTTTGNGKNVVIMGRLTWESIPPEHRPLKKRINIVITRNTSYELPQGVEKAESLEKALNIAARFLPEEIFVIGGSQIFYDAIHNANCATLYITEIEGDFECDTFFPKIDPRKFKKISESALREENAIKFKFVKYRKAEKEFSSLIAP